MGKATQDLRNEHDAILHVFTILDKMLLASDGEKERDLKFAKELVNFLSIFADQCHHAKKKGFCLRKWKLSEFRTRGDQ